MSGIVYRPYRSEDESGLRALFAAVYGPDATRRTSAWRYLAPAPWPAVIQVAESDGRVVGAQPSHGIDLRIAGDDVKGLLLLDVMTHPEHRRRGIFAGVVEGLRERAAAEGYRVLLTTPNRDAERGFARLPAWTKMGELEPWVRVGDAVSLMTAAARTPVGPVEAAAAYPGDRFTAALWSSIAGASPCQLVRDPRFVSWRFGAGSGRRYSFTIAGTTENPEALVMIGEARFLGRDVLTIVDMLVPAVSTAAGVRLLRLVAERARRERRAAVVGWFAPGSGSGRVLRGAGFMRVPRILRPRPYSVWGASDLPGEARRRFLDLNSWSMSLADSDLA